MAIVKPHGYRGPAIATAPVMLVVLYLATAVAYTAAAVVFALSYVERRRLERARAWEVLRARRAHHLERVGGRTAAASALPRVIDRVVIDDVPPPAPALSVDKGWVLS
jgi:hypothetical protein